MRLVFNVDISDTVKAKANMFLLELRQNGKGFNLSVDDIIHVAATQSLPMQSDETLDNYLVKGIDEVRHNFGL